MNKKLIAIAVAGAFSAPMAAQAADVSGFAQIDWTLANDNAACTVATFENCETQFSVHEAEVDFENNGVRVDIDTVNGGGDINVEQANFTTALGAWNLTAGLFNSGLTADSQDIVDMAFASNSLVFDLYDGAGLTNVAGLAFSGMAGPANVTVALVNDPTVNPGATGTATVAGDKANAVVVAASGSVMEGLDIGVSMVSAEADDLTDVIVSYTMDALTAGLDYMTSDAVDAYSVTVGYDLGNGINVKARIDNAELTSGYKTDTTTLHVGYHLADNIEIALENYDYSEDNSANDYSTTVVDLVATF